jgi:pectinesterase
MLDGRPRRRGRVGLDVERGRGRAPLLVPPGERALLRARHHGPGAVASPSRRVLSDGEAQAYTADRVLDGWKPQ